MRARKCPFGSAAAGSRGRATGISVVLGLALIALSLSRGRRSEEHYVGWDKFVI